MVSKPKLPLVRITIILLFICFICAVCFQCGKKDGRTTSDSSQINVDIIKNSSWEYSIKVADFDNSISQKPFISPKMTGEFTIAELDNNNTFKGSGDLNLIGLHIRYNINGNIDKNGNVNMIWNMSLQGAPDIEIYECKYH